MCPLQQQSRDKAVCWVVLYMAKSIWTRLVCLQNDVKRLKGLHIVVLLLLFPFLTHVKKNLTVALEEKSVDYHIRIHHLENIRDDRQAGTGTSKVKTKVNELYFWTGSETVCQEYWFLFTMFFCFCCCCSWNGTWLQKKTFLRWCGFRTGHSFSLCDCYSCILR